MLPMLPEQALVYREKLQAGTDGNLHVDVGYFLIWYSTVELAFTSLLALASGSADLPTFDTLCSGMDLRVKIERFRKIRRARGGIGPNLDARLKYIDEKCRPIRNRLAHCAMSISESGPERYFASTLSTMPWEALGMPPATPGSTPPIVYTPSDLLGWGAWLAIFAHDLSEAFREALQNGSFEIATPRTEVPSANQGSQPRKERPAKADKLGKTTPA